MEEILLSANTTREIGSSSSRRVRKDGIIPGVLYGLNEETVALSVDWPDLRRALTTDSGINAIIQLEIDGKKQMTIVKDIQRHPVRRDVLHVDFLRIDPNENVTVDIPLVMVGEAREVSAADGMVDQNMFSLTVSAPPDRIPTEIEVDISSLTVGDSVRVGDLNLPEGVTTEGDPEEPIAVGMITRSTLESIAADEAAELEALEGEEGAVGDESASEGDSGDSAEQEGGSSDDSGDAAEDG
ncbi:MAG: 50S ribosomal protein L25 [Actinomycetota bacterium]|nr:50S ribosomal protein L25 [Actinomycetota bacterium]|tara:strand:- start:2561 stop:3283 length:723 start_codon:yes stop_codon:yes gene_type:complete